MITIAHGFHPLLGIILYQIIYLSLQYFYNSPKSELVLASVIKWLLTLLTLINFWVLHDTWSDFVVKQLILCAALLSWQFSACSCSWLRFLLQYLRYSDDIQLSPSLPHSSVQWTNIHESFWVLIHSAAEYFLSTL